MSFAPEILEFENRDENPLQLQHNPNDGLISPLARE
jgi:hypothetical protein